MNLEQNTSSLTPDVGENSTLLEQYELYYYLNSYPLAVGYLIILAIVGGIGNAHALVIYFFKYNKSTKRIFVLFLAFADLLACWLVIPFEIFDLRYSFTFRTVVPCKIFRFLNHFVSVCSGLFLGVIALEVHRKVCSPFKRQMSEALAKKIAIVTTVAAIMLSIPSFLLYGPSEKMTEIDIVGSDCTVLAKYQKSMFFWGYTGVFLAISTLIFIICVVAYIRVGRAIYKQLVFRKKALVSTKSRTGGSTTFSRTKSCRMSFDLKEEFSKTKTLITTERPLNDDNDGKFSTCEKEHKDKNFSISQFTAKMNKMVNGSDETNVACSDDLIQAESRTVEHIELNDSYTETAITETRKTIDNTYLETNEEKSLNGVSMVCMEREIAEDINSNNNNGTIKFDDAGDGENSHVNKTSETAEKLLDDTCAKTKMVENNMDANGCSNDTRLSKKKQKSVRFTFDRSKRITLMFLVATAVSYSGILPYCVIILIKIFNNNAYQIAKNTLGQFMPVLLRGYFLNNASNSVVYFLLDTRLKDECKQFYYKLYRFARRLI